MTGFIHAVLARRRERWEALCSRCGACCYQKDRRRGKVAVNWQAPCRWLDTRSRLCTVYDHRFKVCPECRPMTLSHALFTSWLPDTCGYVKAYRKRI